MNDLNIPVKTQRLLDWIHAIYNKLTLNGRYNMKMLKETLSKYTNFR